jgi:tetratricopeptide (TPR) repeat protein
MEEKEIWRSLPTAIGVERADLLLELSQRATYRNSCEEALALAEEARDHLLKAGADETLLVRAYVAESYALASLNRKVEAANVLGKVVEVSRRDSDPFIDDHLRTQALWYSDMKDWQSALNCQLEAIRVNEIDGDQQWLARSYFLAGNCYFQMKDFPLAIDYYKKARAIYKQLKNVTEVGSCDIWIGEAYATLGNGELALTYSNQALDVSRLLCRTPWIVLSLIVKGKAQSLLAEFEMAESTLEEAHYLLVNDSSNQWDLIIEIKSELVNIYRQTNRFGLADEVEARIATIREILE